MAKKKVKTVLPPRMRKKISSSGRVFYYYDTCMKPRKWLALGSDFYEALKKYAELEIKYTPEIHAKINETATFAYVAKHYQREIIPTKAPETQKGNLKELKKLLEFFDDPPAPINEIEPRHISDYLRWRSQTAAVRANREIALFSHIFNFARAKGYTRNANPCSGLKKNKEYGRDVYVSDELFWRIYDAAEQHIKWLMVFSYLTGQRVTDNRTVRIDDIHDGAIWFKQGKTNTRLRVELVGELDELIQKLLANRLVLGVKHDFLFTNKRGDALTYNALRYGIDRAREKAGVGSAEFQFRDLRAKSGTDKDEVGGLEAARVLLGHKTAQMTSHYVRNRKGKLVAPTTEKMKRKK